MIFILSGDDDSAQISVVKRSCDCQTFDLMSDDALLYSSAGISKFSWNITRNITCPINFGELGT